MNGLFVLIAMLAVGRACQFTMNWISDQIQLRRVWPCASTTVLILRKNCSQPTTRQRSALAMTDTRGGFVTGPMYEAMRAERDRLAERLDSAIARNESLIKQRDIAMAASRREFVEAQFGRSLLELVEQLRRLRRAAIDMRVPFDMDRDSVGDAARAEIAEALHEEPTSEAEADEIIDALGAVLQLFIGTGRGDADLLEKMGAGVVRLHERLDLVDAGLSWHSAKRVQAIAFGNGPLDIELRDEMTRLIEALLCAQDGPEQTRARDAVMSKISEVDDG